jgi:integrase
MYTERHLIPALGKMYLDNLTPQQMQAFVSARVRKARAPRGKKKDAKKAECKTLSPRTVQQMHTILRKALNQAMKWRLVERNVATFADCRAWDGKRSSP